MEENLGKLNLSRLFSYIRTNDKLFNKIAIQFSDNILDTTIRLTRILQKEFPSKFFFTVAETSYGICCADEVAALHLQADLILRIGRSCLTQTQYLPVYFMNIQKDVDDDKLVKVFREIEENHLLGEGDVLVNIN
jgi:diphthamide biosynthesis protein 2